MNKKILLLGLVLVLFSGLVNAISGMSAFYPMTSNCIENTLGTDGTNNGATFIDASNGCDFERDDSDYIDISNIINSSFDSGGYMCAWVTQESNNDYQAFVSIGELSANELYYLGNYNTGYIVARMYDGSENVVTGTSSIGTGFTTYRHYCMNFDANGHILDMWENDVDKGSDSSETVTISHSIGFIGGMVWGGASANYYDGKIMGVLLGTGTLTQSNVDELYNGGRTYDPTNNFIEIKEQVEQTTKFKPEDTFLSSTTYTNIMKGKFNTTNITNNYMTFVINAMEFIADEELKCKIKIDGTSVAGVTSRTMEADSAGVMYITSSNFTLQEGEHNGRLKCKTTNGNLIYMGNMLGILHTLKDQTTNENLNMKYVDVTKTLTSSVYSNLGNITFQVSNNSIDKNYKKILLIDGAVQYNYDSNSNITLKLIINGTELSEYPRYGGLGTSGSVGSLRYYEPLQNNHTTNLTIELWGKSSTSDGDINGNIIIKEFSLHNREINSTKLNGTNINSNSDYVNIKSLNVYSEHNEANLVVKAGIPMLSEAGNTRVFARLKIQSENGTEEVRDLSNPNQNGVLIIQEVFEKISSGNYTITLQIQTDNNIKLTGGDLTAYISDHKAFIPNTFKVSATDRTTHTLINYFNVTNINGSIFPATNGSVEVTSDNETDNLTIESPFYITRHIYNHNTTNDLNVKLCSVYNYVTYKTAIGGNPLINADVTIKYPDGSEQEKTTDTNGRINWTTTYLGVYEVTLNSFQGFVTPFNTSYLINETQCNLNMNYSIAQASLIFNVFDRTTGNVLTANTSIGVIGLTSGTTDNGTLIIKNATMSSGEYTVQASSSGYSTEQATFTYTNEENLTINLYLLNLTESTAGTLFISTMDEIFRILQGVKVELFEYQTSALSYIKISECLTNTNGECAFAIELGTKRYITRAEKQINGLLLSDTTNEEGTIYLVDNQIEQLTLRASENFESTILDNLDYTITESFNETTNISDIDVTFKTLNGEVTQVCVEYSIDYGTYLTSLKLVCANSSSGYMLIDTFAQLTDRTKNYVAKVYNINNGNKAILKSYFYPAVNELPNLLKQNNISAIVILFVWILIIGTGILIKKTSLIIVLGLVWSWLQRSITTDLFQTQISVGITIILFLIFFVARKKEEPQ